VTDSTTARIEQRLIAAFAAARASTFEHPDLFARVHRTIEEDQRRRRFRLRSGLALLGFIAANTVLALALADIDNGRITMPWWVVELITNIVLVAIVIGLGPFIKRFGRAYAADVFRANPRTGKSYLVLTDVAYYLIFTSFVMFTITFVARDEWDDSLALQLQHQVARVGGMLLIMGLLHSANVLVLPLMGRLLASAKLSAPLPPPE
jgi:hypothetical protein